MHVAADVDRAVDLIVTELAVIGFRGGRATLLERSPGVRVEDIVAATQAELDVPQQVPEMAI